jgi:hypothetical protein
MVLLSYCVISANCSFSYSATLGRDLLANNSRQRNTQSAGAEGVSGIGIRVMMSDFAQKLKRIGARI